MQFHIYHIIGRCTDYGIIPLKEKIFCGMCKQEYLSDGYAKIYIRKEIVMMETTIYDLPTSFYIPAIQRLAFHLPLVRILGTNHCGDNYFTMFYVVVIVLICS